MGIQASQLISTPSPPCCTCHLSLPPSHGNWTTTTTQGSTIDIFYEIVGEKRIVKGVARWTCARGKSYRYCVDCLEFVDEDPEAYRTLCTYVAGKGVLWRPTTSRLHEHTTKRVQMVRQDGHDSSSGFLILEKELREKYGDYS